MTSRAFQVFSECTACNIVSTFSLLSTCSGKQEIFQLVNSKRELITELQTAQCSTIIHLVFQLLTTI